MDPLAFIAALAWPAVVVFLVLCFRRSIRSMVSNVQVKSVKAFGAEVELEHIAADAVAKVVGAEIPAPFATAEVEAHPPIVTGGPTRPAAPSDDITMTRAELANLVSEFAAIGWTSAKTLPFKSQPRPVIRWEGDRPQVTLWTSDRP